MTPQRSRRSQHTGITDLPLHGGRAPRWLFHRMVSLGRGIMDVLIDEYGRQEVLCRIADPYWFQALSCVLGYDWHSSGTTTVTCAALKASLQPTEHGGLQVARLEIEGVGAQGQIEMLQGGRQVVALAVDFG